MNENDTALSDWLQALRDRNQWLTYGGRHCKPMLAADGDLEKLDERLTLKPTHRAEVAA